MAHELDLNGDAFLSCACGGLEALTDGVTLGLYPQAADFWRGVIDPPAHVYASTIALYSSCIVSTIA
jgi:hypothetical protein